MICTRCLTRLSRHTRPTNLRTLTTTPALSSTPVTTETTTTSTPRSASGAPAATSKPGVAQPFSAPLTPAAKPEAPKSSKASTAPAVVSSVPAGTVLKGLNFLKDKSDPVAMADEEYPAWLWKVLEGKGADAAGGVAAVDEGDLFCKFSWAIICSLNIPLCLGVSEGG